MAPQFPDEIDVFKAPHARLKELLYVYNDMLSATDFVNADNLDPLLGALKRAFTQFKSHELIENNFIMKKLKDRLRAMQIYNSAVCNCHKDNRMNQMLVLVEAGEGLCQQPEEQRARYGATLKAALQDFHSEFLPHMEEEEEVFQPLLMKCFSYEELRDLKDVVLQHHVLAEEKGTVWDLVPETHDKDKEDRDYCAKAQQEPDMRITDLPSEVLYLVMSRLNPRELARCAQVCRAWREGALHPRLWRLVAPVLWANGEWEQSASALASAAEDEDKDEDERWSGYDEDADYDESPGSEDDDASAPHRQVRREARVLLGVTQYVLPRVGAGVTTLLLAHSRALTNSTMSRMLKACPNVEHLDASYTRITDGAFKNLRRSAANRRGFKTLRLAGCSGISRLSGLVANPVSSSQLLTRPACCLQGGDMSWWCDDGRASPASIEEAFETPCNAAPTAGCCSEGGAGRGRQGSPLEVLDVSGCYLVDDHALRSVVRAGPLTSLRHLDVSGCPNISGPALSALVAAAPNLTPRRLYYCDNMEDGPCPAEANGCRNVGSDTRACCRSALFLR